MLWLAYDRVPFSTPCFKRHGFVRVVGRIKSFLTVDRFMAIELHLCCMSRAEQGSAQSSKIRSSWVRTTNG